DRLHIDDAQLAALRQRAQEGLRLVAMRFAEDWTCPAARFARLRAEFGDALEAIEIGRDEGTRPQRGMRHGVLTTDLVDQPGGREREPVMRSSGLVAIGVGIATVTGPSKRPLVRSRWPEPMAKGAPPATLVTISHTTCSARASDRSVTLTGTVKLNSAASAGI